MRFSRGATRQQIVDKLVADQKKLVDDIWKRRRQDLPISTVEEFVTLASIVEKETGRSDERSRVASVFMNRLKTGMRLQSDPTIIYGLFGGKGKPADRPIYQSDLDKPTPYNTYLIDGLPPTPIANPGKAALEAVANPSQTDDLYFVADGTGRPRLRLDARRAQRKRRTLPRTAEEAGRGSRQGGRQVRSGRRRCCDGRSGGSGRRRGRNRRVSNAGARRMPSARWPMTSS